MNEFMKNSLEIKYFDNWYLNVLLGNYPFPNFLKRRLSNSVSNFNKTIFDKINKTKIVLLTSENLHVVVEIHWSLNEKKLTIVDMFIDENKVSLEYLTENFFLPINENATLEMRKSVYSAKIDLNCGNFIPREGKRKILQRKPIKLLNAKKVTKLFKSKVFTKWCKENPKAKSLQVIDYYNQELLSTVTINAEAKHKLRFLADELINPNDTRVNKSIKDYLKRFMFGSYVNVSLDPKLGIEKDIHGKSLLFVEGFSPIYLFSNTVGDKYTPKRNGDVIEVYNLNNELCYRIEGALGPIDVLIDSLLEKILKTLTVEHSYYSIRLYSEDKTFTDTGPKTYDFNFTLFKGELVPLGLIYRNEHTSMNLLNYLELGSYIKVKVNKLLPEKEAGESVVTISYLLKTSWS